MAKQTQTQETVTQPDNEPQEPTQDPRASVSLQPAGTQQPTEPATPSVPPASQQPADTPEKLFSQAELDRIVKDRLDRERSKYADYDDNKKAAARLKEIEDAQKSELEKLQEQVTELQRKAQQTAGENKRLKLTAMVAAIAGQLGAVDPYDANFQTATQAVDPDGDGADDEIKKSIEALKSSRPYLFGRGGAQVAPFNPEGGPVPEPKESDVRRRSRIFGGGVDIWDPKTAKAAGGGVVFTPGWDKPK